METTMAPCLSHMRECGTTMALERWRNVWLASKWSRAKATRVRYSRLSDLRVVVFLITLLLLAYSGLNRTQF